ncbi:hypothetical protein [Mesorhizobium waimense]|uniref:hypothetical protein n=1 Tax=Mesorhizobium waimense TaxID=1300307 RepID=UPI0011C4009E|nr:hypothetical protein [Mesorhizobium waimense]
MSPRGVLAAIVIVFGQQADVSAVGDRNNRNNWDEFGIRLKQPAAKRLPMERTRRDGSPKRRKSR